MEIENGESIIGYQYLHGTDATVGDFYIEGFVFKRKNGVTGYNFTCTWNDLIDVNPIYLTDQVKSKVAEAITLGYAKPYRISITYTSSWSSVNMNSGGHTKSSIVNMIS